LFELSFPSQIRLWLLAVMHRHYTLSLPLPSSDMHQANRDLLPLLDLKWSEVSECSPFPCSQYASTTYTLSLHVPRHQPK
jgi:hypothetical protein